MQRQVRSHHPARFRVHAFGAARDCLQTSRTRIDSPRVTPAIIRASVPRFTPVDAACRSHQQMRVVPISMVDALPRTAPQIPTFRHTNDHTDR
ncbi:hypothetical protein [Burkholderia sp. SCN-KJ]|uniref:hypothetical protein n=1 Tax=Burkholderia sp. SCN-KJ TaxID=2969248 RepID=UPI00214FF657|nr:hypothetical protein [Burkholderia sp. SCN-KJ]MCR4467451.1 hypothetical protein [Burkholderia sp. SCN-KJ]